MKTTAPTALLALAPLALVLLAPPGSARPTSPQLKLPSRPAEPGQRGTVAPYTECVVCGTRNYTHQPSGRVDAEGRELAWCDVCKRDTPQVAPAEPSGPSRGGSGGNLRLPRSQPAGRAPSPPPPGAAPAPVAAPAPAAEPAPAGVSPAAAFVYQELGRVSSPDAGLAQRAVESLLAMRDEGVAAARVHLFADAAVPTVVSARVLLRAGQAGDADLVVRRLRSRLPSGAGAPLLAELVATDPIRATPPLFAALLDHPQAQLRNAAARELARRMEPGVLPLLEAPLASRRTDTRLLALDLVRTSSDPRATALLLGVLDDASARVAGAAVEALGLRDDPDLDAELLRRAFEQRWILRPGAYALLAILEREDAQLRPILGAGHVQPLLEGLGSNDPFLGGTCAAALAGIGFRSADGDVGTWLDGAVLDRLVDSVSGRTFHADHGSLAPAAVRRLRLLTGQAFGPDGPAWVAWWLDARAGFHALRASIPIGPGEEGLLLVRLVPPQPEPPLTLVGPELAADVDALAPDGDAVILTAAQASDAVAALGREGLFSAERLPGAYATDGRSDRTLEVGLRGRTKAFTVGAGAKAPWFERGASLARTLADTNRWQLYLDPARTTNRLEHWRAEAPWWAEEHSEAEEARRVAALALAAMARAAPLRRDRILDELERDWAAGAASAEAFGPLLGRIAEEVAPGLRVQRLASLALAAASAPAAGADAGAAVAATPPPAASQELVGVLEQRFGAAGRGVIAHVLAGSDRAWVRSLSVDPRPVVRAAAAEALARAPDAEDTEALLALLADRDVDVQCAATQALGAARVEAARTDLLARARLAPGAARCYALRAVGELGGDYALDALVLALSDADADVRRAAADGLGSLGDPTAAQVLVSLLGDAQDAPLRDSARASLARLGPAALPALRHAAESAPLPTRREAALVLAALGAPDAVSPLLTVLSESPDDAKVADELTILTCVDARATSDAAATWWSWWDGVRHDDALAWFRAALERLAIQPPPAEAFAAGAPAARLLLVSLLDRPESWLVERAWRELVRLSPGEDLGQLPPRGAERIAWMRAARARIDASAPR